MIALPAACWIVAGREFFVLDFEGVVFDAAFYERIRRLSRKRLCSLRSAGWPSSGSTQIRGHL